MTSPRNENDSLRKRYFYKLSANLVGLFISLITNILIPRGLGPKTYGEFNFLTNFFCQLMSFLDLGTSSAYFTKLSQRPGDRDMVKFYLLFSLLIAALSIGFVALVHWWNLAAVVWPDQDIVFIYVAAGFGIVTWMSATLNQMADAYGLTVTSEKWRMLQKVIGLLLIVALFFLHRLQLGAFFFYNYFITILLAVALVCIMVRNHYISLADRWVLCRERVVPYVREFYYYAYPLFIFSLVGFLANIGDRWLLQLFGGSVQQGYYGLSYQVGAACFLFTGAMTPLLTREFSIAFDKTDLKQMAGLFRRYIPLLYSIAAFLACFMALQAEKVVYIIGGKAYQEALLPVAIMSLFPLHQTYGQLTSSVFLASGKTRLYRNIGVVFLLMGLPVTYFMIAPESMMGLNTGATGMALKTVLLNVISVNVILYFVARQLGINFWLYLGHQIAVLGVLAAVAAVVSRVVDTFLLQSLHAIGCFFLSGIIYTMIVVGIVFVYPNIFGLRRGDLVLILGKAKSIIINITRRK